MGLDTKPNFSNNKFEQCVGDIMNLSGCTQIYGTLDIESGALFNICDGAGIGKILTSDSSGNATWQTPVTGCSGTVTGATNGLTLEGTTIVLGGNLTGDTTICGGDNANAHALIYESRSPLLSPPLISVATFDLSSHILKVSCAFFSNTTAYGCLSVSRNSVSLETVADTASACCAGFYATNSQVALIARGAGQMYICDITDDGNGLRYSSCISNGFTSSCSLVDKGYVDAVVSGSSGGINMSGSTANGITTYVNSTTICTEPNLTFDGILLNINGDVKISGNSSSTICLFSSDNLNPFIAFYCSTGPTRIGYLRGCGTNNSMVLCNDGGSSLTLDDSNTCLFSCCDNCVTGGNKADTTAGGSLYLNAGCNTSTGAGGNINICGGNTSSSGTAGDVIIWAGNSSTGTDGDICLITNGSTTYTGLKVCGGAGAANNYVVLYYCNAAKLCTVTNGICLGTQCGFGVDWVATSDYRLKENIQPISNALSVVDKLCGVCFNLCNDEKHENRIGLIAQDVDKILPEVVSHSKPDENDKIYGIIDEKLGIKYDKLTAVLIEAIKEQQIQITCLMQEISELKNK